MAFREVGEEDGWLNPPYMAQLQDVAKGFEHFSTYCSLDFHIQINRIIKLLLIHACLFIAYYS
jgi:hypothetical protein